MLFCKAHYISLISRLVSLYEVIEYITSLFKFLYSIGVVPSLFRKGGFLIMEPYNKYWFEEPCR